MIPQPPIQGVMKLLWLARRPNCAGNFGGDETVAANREVIPLRLMTGPVTVNHTGSLFKFDTAKEGDVLYRGRCVTGFVRKQDMYD